MSDASTPTIDAAFVKAALARNYKTPACYRMVYCLVCKRRTEHA